MNRKDCLYEAINCVCGTREAEYGSPADNFALIARLWSDYTGSELTALDVTLMMALLKLARIKTGGGSEDSFVDLAGYAALAAEIKSANDPSLCHDCASCEFEIADKYSPSCRDCINNSGKLHNWEAKSHV